MLKSGDSDKIVEYVARLRLEARRLIKSLFELAWSLRGSIQYHDLLLTSYAEREIAWEFVEELREGAKKQMFPIL